MREVFKIVQKLQTVLLLILFCMVPLKGASALSTLGDFGIKIPENLQIQQVGTASYNLYGLGQINGFNAKDILNIITEQAMGKVVSPELLNMCYRTRKLQDMTFRVNVCSIFKESGTDIGEIIDPCKKAPDLSAYGLDKNSNTDSSNRGLFSYKEEIKRLKRRCEGIFSKDQSTALFGRESVNTILENTTPTKTEKTYKLDEDQDMIKKLYDNDDAPMNVKLLTKGKGENPLQESFETLNTAKLKLYERVLRRAESTGSKVEANDLKDAKVNIQANSMEEYHALVNTHADTFLANYEAETVTALMEKAELEMSKIENDTTDKNEAAIQKQAVIEEYISGADGYETIVDENMKYLIHEMMEMNFDPGWYEYKAWDGKKYITQLIPKRFVLPTKDFINTRFKDSERPIAAFFIDQQMRKDAFFKGRMKIIAKQKKALAKLALQKVAISTTQFDAQKAQEELNQLLGGSQ